MHSYSHFQKLFALAAALGMLVACGGDKKPKPAANKKPAKGGAAKKPKPPPGVGEWVRGKRIYFTVPDGRTLWAQFNSDGSADVSSGKTGKFTVAGRDVSMEVTGGKDSVFHFKQDTAAAGDKLEVTQNELDVTLTVAKVEPAQFVATIARMKALVDTPLTPEEAQFVGRRKGEYVMDPGEPATPVEAIYRSDHTCTILYLGHVLDGDDKIIPGEVHRDLTHGIWKIKGDKLYFLDLIWDDNKKSPEEDMEVVECHFEERAKNKIVYIAPKKKDDTGKIISERKFTEEPVEKFKHREMLPYNTPEALQSFPLLESYRQAKLEQDDEEE